MPIVMRLFEKNEGRDIAAMSREFEKDPRHFIIVKGFR